MIKKGLEERALDPIIQFERDDDVARTTRMRQMKKDQAFARKVQEYINKINMGKMQFTQVDPKYHAALMKRGIKPPFEVTRTGRAANLSPGNVFYDKGEKLQVARENARNYYHNKVGDGKEGNKRKVVDALYLGSVDSSGDVYEAGSEEELEDLYLKSLIGTEEEWDSFFEGNCQKKARVSDLSKERDLMEPDENFDFNPANFMRPSPYRRLRFVDNEYAINHWKNEEDYRAQAKPMVKWVPLRTKEEKLEYDKEMQEIEKDVDLSMRDMFAYRMKEYLRTKGVSPLSDEAMREYIDSQMAYKKYI